MCLYNHKMSISMFYYSLIIMIPWRMISIWYKIAIQKDVLDEYVLVLNIEKIIGMWSYLNMTVLCWATTYMIFGCVYVNDDQDIRRILHHERTSFNAINSWSSYQPCVLCHIYCKDELILFDPFLNHIYKIN